MEARVALAALVVGLLGSVIGGSMWISGVAKDVAELQTWKAAHIADSESRLRSLEFTQHDSAGDMKVVLERLGAIDARLAGISGALSVVPMQLVPPKVRPRNRPIRAPSRVDQP